jgi:RimJ/RimL family protein N-acetyltransferase
MLTGSLVRLRAVEMDDLDRYTTWINDPDVTRYLHSYSIYQASRLAEEEWLRRAATQRGYEHVLFAIDSLEEGRHIGSVSLGGTNPSSRRAEMGIMIGDKTCWDRGYGTDAIRTILRFGFDEMNLHRIYLHVHDDNARAIACYKKCGFVEEGRLRHDRYRGGAYHDSLVMGILEDEFRSLYG